MPVCIAGRPRNGIEARSEGRGDVEGPLEIGRRRGTRDRRCASSRVGLRRGVAQACRQRGRRSPSPTFGRGGTNGPPVPLAANAPPQRVGGRPVSASAVRTRMILLQRPARAGFCTALVLRRLGPGEPDLDGLRAGCLRCCRVAASAPAAPRGAGTGIEPELRGDLHRAPSRAPRAELARARTSPSAPLEASWPLARAPVVGLELRFQARRCDPRRHIASRSGGRSARRAGRRERRNRARRRGTMLPAAESRRAGAARPTTAAAPSVRGRPAHLNRQRHGCRAALSSIRPAPRVETDQVLATIKIRSRLISR